MFQRVGAWLNSFVGGLVMAVLSFWSVIGELGSEGSEGWAWVYGLLTCWWLGVAYRANKRGDTAGDIRREEQPLTDEQKARVKAAADTFADVMKEIDLELTISKRKKYNVQSKERKDNEAGEGGAK